VGVDAMHMLERILAFLGGIDIGVREQPIDEPTFLPGIRVTGGTLVFDRARLDWPADLLHEAAHVALTSAARRPALDDALDAEPPDAIGEVEAIAWSFAAATHLGVPLDQLFHADGYRGHSGGLALAYSLGVYHGAAALAALGLCAVGAEAQRLGVQPYPHMLRWLRD
jgi:hypothetical protein